MRNDGWKREVFKQKSLWQVYWLSRRVLPSNPVNRAIFWSLSGLFFVIACWMTVFAYEYLRLAETATLVFIFADLGFIFSLGILGFLIAGFAIFASITKPELFILLAKTPYKEGEKETGLSQLQFVFFNFLNVFSVYLVLLILSLAIQLLFSEPSPLSVLGRYITRLCLIAGYITNASLVLIFGMLFVSAVLRLKAFIWNLYQTVILTVVVEAELQEHRKEGSS